MKKIVHIINTILSLMLSGLGFILMVSPSEMLIENIAGAITLTFGMICLIIGVFFPKENHLPSDKTQKVLKLSILLNSLLNRTSTNSQAIETAQGKREIKRSWEPTAILIWGVFEGLLGIFVIVIGTPKNRILMIIILILTVLLFITSILWKIEDNKEHYGEKKLASIFISAGIVVAIFSVAGIIGYIKTEYDLGKQEGLELPSVVDPNHEDIEISDIESYTLNQLFVKISKDFDGQKLYYKLQHKDEHSANLIIWNDMDEDVVIYVLDKTKEDCYRINFSMLSENLSYADVQGKEDGIILEDNQ